MSPYILLASALVLLSIVAWLWEAGETRGDPARLLMVWLAFSAVTAIIAAAGIWIEDASVSLSFTAVARILLMVVVFLLFLFTRSFSVQTDYTILFWSVPLQLGMAMIMVNWQHMFARSGGFWVMDTGDPAAIVVITVSWFYGVLALVYAVVLYLTLRREGREKEKGRTLLMIAALAVLFVSGSIRTTISGASSYIVSTVYLGYLAGVLMLVWAIRGPRLTRPTER